MARCAVDAPELRDIGDGRRAACHLLTGTGAPASSFTEPLPHGTGAAALEGNATGQTQSENETYNQGSNHT